MVEIVVRVIGWCIYRRLNSKNRMKIGDNRCQYLKNKMMCEIDF